MWSVRIRQGAPITKSNKRKKAILLDGFFLT
jgi:hypothetical protein